MRRHGTFETHWLRREYQGREHELVSFTEIAQMARVQPKAVGAWAMRYRTFPAPVKEVHAGSSPTRYFVAREVAAWLDGHRAQGRKHDPNRLSAYIGDLDAQIAEREAELAHLVSIRDQVRSVIDSRDTPS